MYTWKGCSEKDYDQALTEIIASGSTRFSQNEWEIEWVGDGEFYLYHNGVEACSYDYITSPEALKEYIQAVSDNWNKGM